MSAERYVWGLDIGGTKCAVVAAGRDGKPFFRRELATKDYPAWQDMLSELIALVRPVYPEPAAVGVSCGSPMDSARGLILSPPNLPGWDNVPVVSWLEERLHVPAFLQNDANACAMAEWRYGAGQGTRNMIFLTFGTGFGAGLILDGRVYEGTNGMAGEIGHVRLTDDGPEGYGKRGSCEGYCSGGGLRRLSILETGRDLSAKELVQLAESGDEASIRTLETSARMLGRSVAILIDLFNPERIVIGSIFQRAEKWFRPLMEEVAARECVPVSYAACTVVPAQLGDAIGDIAAATIAWDGLDRRTNA